MSGFTIFKGQHERDPWLRFAGRVRMAETGTCWEWGGSRTPGGYGKAGEIGRRTPGRAHRLSYQLHFGAIPPGFHVLHLCDNPPCVNVEHLFLGTDKDNTADRIAKGRRLLGERARDAKLTDAAVRQIRARAANGESYRALGREFGVSGWTASLAVRGLTWKHV